MLTSSDISAAALTAMAAIQQRIAAYSYLFDAGDANGWAALFSKDGIWEKADCKGGHASRRLEGRAELRNFCDERFELTSNGLRFAHHQSGTLFDDLTADAALSRTMVILTVTPPGEQPHIALTGVYHDMWEREAGGWLLAHRLLTP